MDKKIKKILLVISGITTALAVAILLLDLFAMKTPEENKSSAGIANDSRLADPDLLYAYLYSAGLCLNSKGEQGGCYAEFFLYNSGKLVKEIGFEGVGGKKEISPDEIDLGPGVAGKVAKQISDSGIMGKDCPPDEIMDAGWDYQISFNGEKKFFRNPAAECKTVFGNINAAINSAAGQTIIN